MNKICYFIYFLIKKVGLFVVGADDLIQLKAVKLLCQLLSLNCTKQKAENICYIEADEATVITQ